ncbi:hypothetical protein [Thalassobaculum sp.]|uniref:hypothetical protein n=1 Tax=Thalassobaculum sp. TaxID=2022740 RepID=UPI0032EBC576
MIKTFVRAAAVMAVVSMPFSTASVGFAASDKKHEHKHDHEAVAKHGGTVAEVGSYDVEIVIADGKIVAYVYDEHGKDISKKASKGDAIFVVSGASKKVSLSLVDDRLEGALGFATSPSDHLDLVLRLVVAGKTHTGKADVHPK